MPDRSTHRDLPDTVLPSSGKRYPVVLGQSIAGELGIRNPDIAAHLRAAYPAPEPKSSAPSIKVLIDRLRREDNGRYLYRGQTRRYPALVPSIYRGAMMPGAEGDPVIAIDPARFHASLSERERIRLDILQEMMATYGPSVGNVIAQQYGLNSEAMDVTQDIGIAAFFATRRYPKYSHFPGTTDNTEGVINRFPVHERIPDLGSLDTLLTFALKHIEPFGDVGFVAFRKRADLKQQQIAAIQSLFEQTGGTIQAEVRTRPLVVDNVFYEREIRASWEKSLARHVPPFADTRLSRQAGGSIRTISRWIASIPAVPSAVEVPQLGFVFDPPFAIGEELIAVENVDRYPGLEIFPFKHAAENIIDIDPSSLWPLPAEDWVYDDLMQRFAARHREYLERHNVAVNDFQKGLIDPGYERTICG